MTVTNTVDGASNFAVLTSTVGASNVPPDCSNAHASRASLWPQTHALVDVSIQGITDPDADPIGIVIESVTQDQPTRSGHFDRHPDAVGLGASSTKLRAESSGWFSDRAYKLGFVATDPRGGSCRGTVTVCVPVLPWFSCRAGDASFDATK